jgi:endonuclease-3
MARESRKARRERTERICRELDALYPAADCSLDWRTPFELLVATILAAQCTDSKVNEVTPELFRRYRSAAELADADPHGLEALIRPTGFYRNKARNLRGAARRIVEDFSGEVPAEMDGLLSLPGVARKTANVVLGTAFGKNEGLVVDTHVTRIAGRLKLTRHENNQGDRIEKDLAELVPRQRWTLFSHQLVHHGRNLCTARKPRCGECPLAAGLCPTAGRI